MADRRTKKTAKQIFGYARLNFHMGMRQGKNLAVLLCMGCFLLYYLGGFVGIWHRQKKRSVCRSYFWL